MSAREEFLETDSDWQNYASHANAEILENYLRYKKIPITLESLRSGMETLVQTKRIRPLRQGIIDSRDAVWVRDSVTPEDREKCADHLHEPDVARKKRDEKLRQAAITSIYQRRH